jgi:hypothetical protein
VARSLYRTITPAFFALALAADLDAQASSQDERVAYRPRFGAVFGAESVPMGLDRTCADPTGRRAFLVVGGFLEFPIGPLALQGRVAGHHTGTPLCGIAGPTSPGVVTEQVPEVPPGSFTTLEVRLRWAAPTGGPLVASVGGGWAASSKDLPFVTTSLGLRSRVASARLGVDLELGAYRAPWTERVTDYSAASPTILTARPYTAWATAFGVLFSLELPVRRESQ